jgi:GNAT superfamily N-acetyltransferase
MSGLEIRRVQGDELVEAWRQVHNTVIPTAPLSAVDVVERAGRNVLEVALVDGVVVGCSTVRPATPEEPVTVIVRILPEHRRRGLGAHYLDHALAAAAEMGADLVQTVVLESNADGLEFALRRGFVETQRYVLDGESLAYVHLARALAPDAG